MGSAAKVTYRFAAADDGRPVDILSLRDVRRQFGRFTCLACGSRVVPHLGSVKAHHFQHFDSQHACHNRETYLHCAAKAVFADEFASRRARGEPFWLHFTVRGTCTHYAQTLGFECPSDQIQRQDLTKYFDRITLEASHGGFVADALLASDSRPTVLLFEFAVTHPCGAAKIASGLRIVEIPIKTDTDVARLRSGIIDATQSTEARCYNLRPRLPHGSLCDGGCPKRLAMFLVYKSGKAHMHAVSAQQAAQYRKTGSAVYSRLVADIDDPGRSLISVRRIDRAADSADQSANDAAALFERESIRAHFAGCEIKSCYVCRHHGINGVTSAVWCKAKRSGVSANDAADCDLYEPCTSAGELRSVQRRNRQWWSKHGVAFVFSRLF